MFVFFFLNKTTWPVFQSWCASCCRWWSPIRSFVLTVPGMDGRCLAWVWQAHTSSSPHQLVRDSSVLRLFPQPQGGSNVKWKYVVKWKRKSSSVSHPKKVNLYPPIENMSFLHRSTNEDCLLSYNCLLANTVIESLIPVEVSFNNRVKHRETGMRFLWFSLWCNQINYFPRIVVYYFYFRKVLQRKIVVRGLRDQTEAVLSCFAN